MREVVHGLLFEGDAGKGEAGMMHKFEFLLEEQGVTIAGYKGEATTVDIPAVINGHPVAAILMYAFSDCSGLSSISIPNRVTEIGSHAFSGCSGLSSIAVDELNTRYSGINGVLFSKDGTTLVYYPAGKIDAAYNIPDSVTEIGMDAFSECSRLSSITIPKSVTEIGSHAFSGCSGLSSITVDELNTRYSGINGVLFSKDGTTLVCYPAGKIDAAYNIPNSVTAIGNEAFSGCSGLSSITIPNSVTEIGFGAFEYCRGLSSISIPGSVTEIKGHTFFDCSSLSSIIIPNSVTKISFGAFKDCISLPATSKEAILKRFGDEVF
jgi:hypothetical protein